MSIENRELKPGTVLVARYKKGEHRCEVVAGEGDRVHYRLPDGREFKSPSAAGTAVMGGVACNGWRFWSLEGDLPAPKATSAATKPKTARKATAKAGGRKGKGARKPKGGAKPKQAARPSANGAEAPKPKPVVCGECGKEFPDAAEATAHMRDEHGSPEAQPGAP